MAASWHCFMFGEDGGSIERGESCCFFSFLKSLGNCILIFSLAPGSWLLVPMYITKSRTEESLSFLSSIFYDCLVLRALTDNHVVRRQEEREANQFAIQAGFSDSAASISCAASCLLDGSSSMSNPPPAPFSLTSPPMPSHPLATH